MRDSAEFVSIGVEQLRVGLFIQLDLSWIDHPFFSSSFKIADEKQLRTLRSLGLRQIRYCPAKSDVQPLAAALEVAAPPPPAAETAPDPEREAAMAEKRARIERLQKHNESVRRCEQALISAGRDLKLINENLFSRPGETVRIADALVGRMTESMLTDKDVALHAINDKAGSEDVYYHSLNVTVLSMMLARELGHDQIALRLVGLGALFHDIGKRNLPDKLLRKTEALTRAEQNLLDQHVAYGIDIGRDLGLPEQALRIIAQHHESADGQGFPAKLRGDAIDPLARLVAVVNAFDNHCNPANLDKAMTPHEAVSNLFAKLRPQFDAKILSTFIRFMGVYPPGTLVRLSNDAWGLVLSVNVRKPLKPCVLIHDPAIPREEAMMVDLETEPTLNISKAYRPGQLPRETLEYLNPRKRITYYFDEEASGPPA